MSRVIEIQGDLDSQLRNARTHVCVVDFYATWCGPCKMLHPRFDEMSMTYTDVTFFRVDSDQNREIASSNGIRALPTIFFYLDGEHVDTIQGYNPEGIEAKINELRARVPSSFSGSGFKMNSGSSSAYMPEDVRQARLKKFNELRNTMMRANSEESKASAVNAEYSNVFNQLLEMGFDENSIKKALEACGPQLENAIEYLSKLQEEEENGTHIVCDGDKCRIVRDTESSDVPMKSLEERTREVRQLIEQKKKEKIERERKEQIEKEKQRRKEGHLVRNQMEEYEKIVRQQEVQQQMKMREETKLERERQLKLWQEVHGSLPTKEENSADASKPEVTLESQVEAVLKVIKLQRINNMGNQALSLLEKILTNAMKEDPKYRTLKVDTNTFKNKIKPVPGTTNILKLAGFELIDDAYVMHHVEEDKIVLILGYIQNALQFP